ncbi:MAG: hypothetical protein H6R10_3070 [Rhodocyclaceae bacterium]|nr:hypothetical protein [Rhodocyclaceae bacterium]
MHANSMPSKAIVAGLVMLLAGAAQGETYYLTRVDARTSPATDPAIKVRGFREPVAFVLLTNTSDRATRCRMDFSTGPVPAGTSFHTVAPHGRWIERSPVAGQVGIIDVNVSCS